jgi:hypothetical protein
MFIPALPVNAVRFMDNYKLKKYRPSGVHAVSREDYEFPLT